LALIEATNSVEVFPTRLGWMALVGRDCVVTRLSFGHRTPLAARVAVEEGFDLARDRCHLDPALVERLQAYAEGARDDFRDVEVEPGSRTDFQRRVMAACRAIPYGETLSYQQLAEAAGSPRAARAVGNAMSTNRVALIIPCHRVVAAGGRPGGYSAGEGVRLKLRLLEMEASATARA